jgi:hypothetical protein
MIILLGFPKTATMSFTDFFEDLSFNTLHFTYDGEYVGELIYRARRENKPLLHYLSGIDVITKLSVCLDEFYNFWPQLDLYEELYNQYPDNIYILNRRSPSALYTSFLNFGSFLPDFCQYNAHRLDPFEGTIEEKFMACAQKHYDDVIQFFSDKPTAKFIDYNIETDTIDKLNIYIDTQGKQLPVVNVTE